MWPLDRQEQTPERRKTQCLRHARSIISHKMHACLAHCVHAASCAHMRAIPPGKFALCHIHVLEIVPHTRVGDCATYTCRRLCHIHVLEIVPHTRVGDCATDSRNQSHGAKARHLRFPFSGVKCLFNIRQSIRQSVSRQGRCLGMECLGMECLSRRLMTKSLTATTSYG